MLFSTNIQPTSPLNPHNIAQLFAFATSSTELIAIFPEKKIVLRKTVSIICVPFHVDLLLLVKTYVPFIE